MSAKWLMVSTLLAGFLAGACSAADEAPKIDRATAERIALKRVPGGHVKEGELETEHGKRVWSFDIAQPGSPDILEIQVDANTGAVVATETETPDQQAKETQAEKKEKKK
jgi:hypothetical protein